jgi:hypothetical protein
VRDPIKCPRTHKCFDDNSCYLPFVSLARVPRELGEKEIRVT